MPTPFVQVDAFTDTPFRGNPAAVCVLAAARDAAWMQLVAREMNLAETAFLVRRPDGSYDLRWFTPLAEVPLCGHATLASAHVLWQDGHIGPGEQARFHTLSGLLTADQQGDWIELDFPADPVQLDESPPDGIERMLGAPPVAVLRGANRFLVELADEATVRALTPDVTALAALPVQGVVVTARGAGRYDIVSRYFAPRVGVPEDPVTGAAHCTLAGYWCDRLGTDELLAYQASARGGVLRVRREGDRVRLGGQAVTVLRGELLD